MRKVATGKSFKAPFAHVWKLQDGKAASFQRYTDTAIRRMPLNAWHTRVAHLPEDCLGSPNLPVSGR